MIIFNVRFPDETIKSAESECLPRVGEYLKYLDWCQDEWIVDRIEHAFSQHGRCVYITVSVKEVE